MGQLLLLLVVAVTVAAVVFGVTVLITGRDPGLAPAEPDGRAMPLPVTRPLVESDLAEVRFDTGLRGYRMAQVDQAMRRAAYDIGYKDELIGVLEAEVTALREGRTADADVLRRAREAALAPVGQTPTEPVPAGETASGPDAGGGPVSAATEPAAVAPDAAPDRAPDAATDRAPIATDPEPIAAHPVPTRGESLSPPPANCGPADEPADRTTPPATNGTAVPPLRDRSQAEPAIGEGGIDSVTRAETPEDGRVGCSGSDMTKNGPTGSPAAPTADAPAERP